MLQAGPVGGPAGDALPAGGLPAQRHGPMLSTAGRVEREIELAVPPPDDDQDELDKIEQEFSEIGEQREVTTLNAENDEEKEFEVTGSGTKDPDAPLANGDAVEVSCEKGPCCAARISSANDDGTFDVIFTDESLDAPTHIRPPIHEGHVRLSRPASRTHYVRAPRVQVRLCQ